MENASYLNLNGHLLKVFLAIYDTNSVSKAAEKFDLNQSTISYSLEKLRNCLGDPLFVKAGRGITPTDRAIMLAPHIRAQLAGLEGLVNTEKYLPHQDTQRVTIAANITEMLPQCERLYRSIVKIAPQMPIRMLEMGSRQNVVRLLETGSADLVLTAKMAQCPVVLAAQSFFQAAVVCYYDPDVRGPLETVEDYCSANHAVLDFGGGAKSQIDQFLEEKDLSRNKQLLAPNVYALGQLVRGTDLVVTMHTGFRHTVLSHLSHCEPPMQIPDIVFDMIWHRRAEYSGRNVWLRNLVMTFMSEGMGL